MSKKILIVDDDPQYREATTTMLEAKGYEVFTAKNGQEGFDKAIQIMPHLILLDVMMTHKSEGFDIARNLRQSEAKNIPVIIVTGVRKEMSLPFGFQPDDDWLPVKAVLEKPVKPEMLLDAISQHI
ncbi:MAG: response regulator [Candidatus Aureabacteria bacterium]|nr:response regulator [Candidatus Auribacterota bacterium]